MKKLTKQTMKTHYQSPEKVKCKCNQTGWPHNIILHTEKPLTAQKKEIIMLTIESEKSREFVQKGF